MAHVVGFSSSVDNALAVGVFCSLDLALASGFVSSVDNALAVGVFSNLDLAFVLIFLFFCGLDLTSDGVLVLVL